MGDELFDVQVFGQGLADGIDAAGRCLDQQPLRVHRILDVHTLKLTDALDPVCRDVVSSIPTNGDHIGLDG